MSGPGRCAVAPGLLTALLVAACAGAGAAGQSPGTPESRLRARIADSRADVELLKVECAAARHNLLECLKKSGHLELGDREIALSQVKAEIRDLNSNVPQLLKRNAEMSGIKEDKEQKKLMADLTKGGDAGEKALNRLAEIEYQARLDSARAESDRRRADFLKKVRALNQKKMELAEAEAEYKSSR